MTKLVEQDANHTVEETNIVPPPPYTGDRPQVITSDTARQAPLGTPVLWVLIAAIVLVVVGFLGAYMFSGTPHVG